MGILDDAIREHLELKRQHGADDDDVDRLEKEAFGPPTRPGDPEFDTSEDQAAAPVAISEDVGLPSTAPPEAPEPGGGEAGGAPQPAAGEPEAPAPGGGLFDAEAGDDDEDWLSSLEDVVEQPVVEPAAEPEPAPEGEAHGSATSPIEDETAAERARIEHADLDDTVDHPAVPPPETGKQEEEAGAPPEPPESAIFDQGEEADFGDLDLDLEEAELEPEPQAEAAAAGEEEFLADDAEEDELEDEDEDLLEETPDFLQDTPEGERLWFEQGAPKDFDFDDEDEDDD